jgi:hypothetical protein
MMRSIEIVMLFQGGTWETAFVSVPATHFADDEMVREYLDEHNRFTDDVVAFYVWSRPNQEPQFDPRLSAALSRRSLTEGDWPEIVHGGGSLRDEIESEIGAVFNEDGEDIGRDGIPDEEDDND